LRPPTKGQSSGAFHSALADVQASVGDIGESARHSMQISTELDERMREIGAKIERTDSALQTAVRRSGSFLTVSEKLVEIAVDNGIQTGDTPYIDACMKGARQIADMFEHAVAQGAIAMEDLFDVQYRTMAASNPPQYTTRCTVLAEQLLPQVQERLAQLSKVEACFAVDRNGYCPTHNRKYNLAQRNDAAWNDLHSRHRRRFDDAVGLRAARSEQNFLLQTYRRDDGQGHAVIRKEVDAPIHVGGRHWGALRLVFGF